MIPSSLSALIGGTDKTTGVESSSSGSSYTVTGEEGGSESIDASASAAAAAPGSLSTSDKSSVRQSMPLLSSSPPPASSGGGVAGPPPEDNNNNDGGGSADYWTYATGSVQYATDTVKTTVNDTVSYLFRYDPTSSPLTSEAGSLPDVNNTHSEESALSRFLLKGNRDQPFGFRSVSQPLSLSLRRRNPYTTHRRVDQRPNSSLIAVRSLLSLVPEKSQYNGGGGILSDSIASGEEMMNNNSNGLDESMLSLPESADGTGMMNSKSSGGGRGTVSDAEKASGLAEGTIRAMRDLALDEAVSLHESLRFWTERWERPALSWLEAGPVVWSSQEGYNHQLIGQRVSQIQAVLARRCAAIGELQQHLLRAGWQKGVAQWGVLGQGGQWAAVAGGDGKMEEQDTLEKVLSSNRSADELSNQTNVISQTSDLVDEIHILPHPARIGAPEERDPSSPSKALKVATTTNTEDKQQRSFKYYGRTSNVWVKNTRGGGIHSNDPALAAWAVDAIRVVRDQLYRAGNGAIQLPYVENWPHEENHFRDDHRNLVAEAPGADDSLSLPLWATEDVEEEEGGDDSSSAAAGISSDKNVSDGQTNSSAIERGVSHKGDVVISDLPLMAAEVSALLNSMEVQMDAQRNRRLVKLQPPQSYRRRWYVVAIGVPLAGYVAYKLLKGGMAVQLSRLVVDKITSFYAEHVSGPIRAIYYELLTRRERENISDRQARMDAMESLKHMIKSWLDDTYPDMNETERKALAENMDVSLIEKRKEDSIKHIYEINSVVRMSLIEMQFIKKELMNAMYAMDELMSSNEININLASVTPALLLIYCLKHVFRFLWYALLKLGKSREETYASFRLVVLDMERLLLMRDNPPSAPPPLTWGTNVPDQLSPKRPRSSSVGAEGRSVSAGTTKGTGPDEFSTAEGSHTIHDVVLKSNDLGMLMLHIHECRTIMWEGRRRFSRQIVRNVFEDLAELAGERGPVSVRQQLQIITRMSRTYPFLKVVSSGVAFDFVNDRWTL